MLKPMLFCGAQADFAVGVYSRSEIINIVNTLTSSHNNIKKNRIVCLGM